MNSIRYPARVNAGKWARYKHNLTTAIGENGKRVTGSSKHIELSKKIAAEGMVLLENNGFSKDIIVCGKNDNLRIQKRRFSGGISANHIV